ncbi:hypothetical protein EAY64_07200 [Aquitalea palustris]|uniref:Uncharacterized protein n=1 Tax=Aquitalea palustris TaxID=2480983 RepID=A0A454JJX8_9NEIS|nr:hypothetical protein [Aquitalea palustris]RMC99552.1 hypothetical protein EAY64_07200 [Aquitalea palustris]
MYQRIVHTIHSVMPEGADITEYGEGHRDWIFSVFWLLGNDPIRPNKRSRTILIQIDHAVIDDIREADPDHITLHLEHYLRQKLAQFNPDHAALRHQIPPVDEWTLLTEHLM